MYGLGDSIFANTGYGTTWCFLTGGLLASIVSFKMAIVTALARETLSEHYWWRYCFSIISHKYGIDTYTSVVVFFWKIGNEKLYLQYSFSECKFGELY